MNANELRRQIFNLEAELESLRMQGVFRLVPRREERSDGKGEWLEFKSRGATIVDRSVSYVRRLSLPLERNEDKANRLLRKAERTKQAEKLVLQINNLKATLKEQQRKAAEAEELRHKSHKLKYQAEDFIHKSHKLKYQAEDLTNKAAEYAARANALRNRAAHYAQQAAALQPA